MAHGGSRMIELPRLPTSTAYSLRMVRNSDVQRSGTGGAMTPLSRQGDHWAVEIDPGVLARHCGQQLLSDIACGATERIRVPLARRSWGYSAGPAPVVEGSDQAGTTLIVSGLQSGGIFPKGDFFTLETAEGPTAHLIRETVLAGTGGVATFSFWPALWLPPADGDSVEINYPYLEGLVVDEGSQTWRNRWTPTSHSQRQVPVGVITDKFLIEEG